MSLHFLLFLKAAEEMQVPAHSEQVVVREKGLLVPSEAPIAARQQSTAEMRINIDNASQGRRGTDS